MYLCIVDHLSTRQTHRLPGLFSLITGEAAMKFEKISLPSQRELFIKKMQEMIISGELAVNERIPPERELAQELGISRTVVNAGIAVLVNQGFLQVRPRQGTFVADYKKEASAETLNAIMRLKGDVLSDSDIRSILEIRWALERLTMKNAIESLTPDAIEDIDKTVESIKDSDSFRQAAENALSFQIKLAELGGNAMLSLIIVTFRAPCIAMWIRFCKIYGINTLYEHTLQSWKLVKARDYDGIRDWIETFSNDAIDGKYTLYEKDLRK